MIVLPLRLTFDEQCFCLVSEWIGARRARGERVNAKARRHLHRKASRFVTQAAARADRFHHRLMTKGTNLGGPYLEGITLVGPNGEKVKP